MIDYLEQLLDREAEEEEQEAFVWPRIGSVRRRDSTDGTVGEEGTREEENEASGEKRNRMGREMPMTEGAEGRTAEWEAVFEELVQAVGMDEPMQGRKLARAEAGSAQQAVENGQQERGSKRKTLAQSQWEQKMDPERTLAELMRGRKTGPERTLAELTRGGKTGPERMLAELMRGRETDSERSPAESAWERKADLARSLAELGRAVVRGRNGQVGPIRSARVEAGRAAEARGDVRRGDDLPVETRRGLARRLDAVFERDARRYDGPLGLL